VLVFEVENNIVSLLELQLIPSSSEYIALGVLILDLENHISGSAIEVINWQSTILRRDR
jgi:hypothetical protein